MKKIISTAFIILTVFAFYSCDTKAPKLGVIDFGEIKPGDTATKKLTLNFNDEAKNDDQAFVEFIFEMPGDVYPEGIEFIVDGEVVTSNKLRFYAKDFKDNLLNERMVGIKFPEDAKEQVYAGSFRLVNASAGLKDYITHGPDHESIQVGEPVVNMQVEVADPLPWWLNLIIFAFIFAALTAIVVYVLTRNDMPFGKKSFKNGVITLFDGDEPLPSVRLDKLIRYNISDGISALNEELVLEPLDKIYNGKKCRFAQLKNNTSLDLKILHDDEEEIIGTLQELYHNDEVIIKNIDNTTFTIRYSNFKIIRN